MKTQVSPVLFENEDRMRFLVTENARLAAVVEAQRQIYLEKIDKMRREMDKNKALVKFFYSLVPRK